MKNGDAIRSMTDEELAEWIAYRQGCYERQDKRCSKYGTCRDCWFDWLKQEAFDNGACSADETSEKVQDE